MAKWRSFTRSLATAWRSIRSSWSSRERQSRVHMSAEALPDGWKSVRLIIQGRVQGVSYRYWTVTEATGRGLDGWVRNRRDGSVEAFISGPASAVDEMIEACRRGPRSARVTQLDVTDETTRAEPGFRQLPTA